MTDMELSPREMLLLTAALHPDPATAASNWEQWSSQVPMEEAPYPELRLLPAVYANLSRIAPALKLPMKLRGKVRATFTKNNLLLHGAMPVLRQLSRETPVVLLKGAAFCFRFDAWAVRPMGDIDIQVRPGSLERVAAILGDAGWTPRYGLTWASLVHRTSRRRGNWNVCKDRLELDLHWHLLATADGDDRFDRHMWKSAERATVLGQELLVQSPEASFVMALRHGFVDGTRGDALQAIVDSASWLPVCRKDALAAVLAIAGLRPRYDALLGILEKAGRPELRGPGLPPEEEGAWTRFGKSARRNVRRFRAEASAVETAVLRHPAIYRLWQIIGPHPSLERMLLRLGGPFSKPVVSRVKIRDEYNLLDCAVIDRLGGPGFGWPGPEQTCFWSDRSDARLLVPLREASDHILVLELADKRRFTPYPHVDVFANGVPAARLELDEAHRPHGYSIAVSRSMLFGSWVELSFRPVSYAGAPRPTSAYQLKRSVPFRRLRVYSASRLNAATALLAKILEKSDPLSGKYQRIVARMSTSEFKAHADIPKDFDPIAYVMNYWDLFEAEVDPYRHYVQHGKGERRVWR